MWKSKPLGIPKRARNGRRVGKKWPAFLLLRGVFLILLAEALTMTVVEFAWPGGFLQKTLADEVIFVIVTLPILHITILQPLLRVIAQSTRAEEELATVAREMAAQNAVSQAAAGELKPEVMLTKVIEAVLCVFEADGGWVLLPGDDPKDTPRIVGVRGFSPSLLRTKSAEHFLDDSACGGWTLKRMLSGVVTLTTECEYLPRGILQAAGFESYVGVTLPAGHRIEATLNLVWRTPRSFDPGDQALLRAIARNVAIAAESAAIYEAERRARAEADVISSAALTLNESLDLDSVLQKLFELLASLVPYDRAKVMLCEGNALLKVEAIFSPSGSKETAGMMPATFEADHNPLLTEVLEGRKCVLVPDLTTHVGKERRTASKPERSWLGVPLLAAEKAVGLVTLVKSEPGFYDFGHVRIARAIATAASIAIANARMFGEILSGRRSLEVVSRKLMEVQEQERRHLARELHDEIGQSLTAILYHLQAIQGNRSARRDLLNEAIEITARTMRAIRNISMDLHPTILDEAGLPETLRWYIDRQVRSRSLEVRLSVSPGVDVLTPEVRRSCFRIVQEALTNVVRHAGARHVNVDLGSSGSSVKIAVCDDGRGFDVEEAYRRARAGGSLGILGMRERAELLGGELVFESTPGAGTTVKASVPLMESD